MLPIPNPQDWLDTRAVAEMLGVDRSSVLRMPREVLNVYRLGSGRTRFYWRPQVVRLADARRLLGRTQ